MLEDGGGRKAWRGKGERGLAKRHKATFGSERYVILVIYIYSSNCTL